MFDIKITDNTTYCEIHQVNPLRWKTLFKEEDGTFTDQSGWVKCKDFYNDTVAYFKEGTVFSIYGYDNKVKRNDGGVYFLLKHIQNKGTFVHNLNVMNVRLFKDLKCSVGYWDHEGDKAVIFIPAELWESTYRISMVTFVIRLCNYQGFGYETWDDFWAPDAPANTVETAFSTQAKKNAKEMGFTVPAKYDGLWYFAGEGFDSKLKPKQTGGVIHNNGVTSWSLAMSNAK